MTDHARETCTRCGHQSKGCDHCDQTDPFLGASINGNQYCHTFSPDKPSCYESASWERPRLSDIFGDPFLVPPPILSAGPRPSEES